jgi:hypothetical protein
MQGQVGLNFHSDAIILAAALTSNRFFRRSQERCEDADTIDMECALVVP